MVEENKYVVTATKDRDSYSYSVADDAGNQLYTVKFDSGSDKITSIKASQYNSAQKLDPHKALELVAEEIGYEPHKATPKDGAFFSVDIKKFHLTQEEEKALLNAAGLKSAYIESDSPKVTLAGQTATIGMAARAAKPLSEIVKDYEAYKAAKNNSVVAAAMAGPDVVDGIKNGTIVYEQKKDGPTNIQSVTATRTAANGYTTSATLEVQADGQSFGGTVRGGVSLGKTGAQNRMLAFVEKFLSAGRSAVNEASKRAYDAATVQTAIKEITNGYLESDERKTVEQVYSKLTADTDLAKGYDKKTLQAAIAELKKTYAQNPQLLTLEAMVDSDGKNWRPQKAADNTISEQLRSAIDAQPPVGILHDAGFNAPNGEITQVRRAQTPAGEPAATKSAAK